MNGVTAEGTWQEGWISVENETEEWNLEYAEFEGDRICPMKENF